TDQDGNVIFSGTVTQDMLDNGLDLSIDPPATGTNLVVTATVTTPSGNTAEGSDNATLDYGVGSGAPAAPTVVITEDANNDGYINDAELNGQIDITVTLGAGTAVGDTLVVTDQDGTVIFSGPVTQDMLDNGLDLTMDPPATGTDFVVTATVTDPAGNSAEGSDNATLDYGVGSGAPSAPTVTITEDANNDGYINDAELSGQVDITVTLGAGTAVGDTVTVTDQDGNVIFSGTVTQDMLDNGLSLAVDAPATGDTLAITATVTDPAGNSAEGSDQAVMDYGVGTGAPASPTVVITEDANNDGTINDGELNGQIDISVTLGAGTAVGDTLTVTDQDGNTLFSGPVTQAMLDNGLALTLDAPAAGTTLTVNANVTDPAGNTANGSDSAVLDVGSTAPGTPVVTITEDADNDGYINDAELVGQVNITVALTGGTAVGDTLVVTDQDGNTLFSGPVTQAMLDNGLGLAIDAPASGTTLVVTATVTDAAGNTANGSDSAILDTSGGNPNLGAPTLTIDEDANNDGYINDDELDGDINFSVALGAGTEVGDSLVITDQAGNEVFNGTVTQAMLDNGLSLTMTPPATGTGLTLTATVTDTSGNSATGSDSATLDHGSSAPTAPTVVITEDANGDGYINDGELSGEVDITITLGTGTAVGDTIVVTDNAGNTLYEGPVTQDMLDNGLDLSVAAPATGTELEITATVTDPAGNSAEGSDSATLDYGTGSGAPASPTVVIDEDANNDGYINSDELDGDINITVTLGAGTAVGDTLVVTDQDGNALFNGTVTQAMLDNGVPVTMTAPATGTTLTVTATVTDPAGNTANGSDAATLDHGTGTGAPAAPTVEITEDANDDGYINDDELDGQVDITITLGAGTAVGDTLVVTDQDGNTLFEGPVTQEMLDNGLDLSIDPPATGTTLEVTATITDPAGNSAQGSESATLDYGVGSGAPAAPTVTITEDADNDGYISDDELDGDINITVTLGAGTAVGDTLIVTDQDGNALFNGAVTQAMLDNGVPVTMTAPATGTTITVTATVTDPAGNTANGSDSATLDYGDSAPTAPTVVITEDANNDGYINDAELNGQIDISVTLGSGTDVGDTIEVTDQNDNVIFSGTVTQDMLDNGLQLAVDAPATGTTLAVTATITDPAGNSAEGSDSATLDYGAGIGAPAAPVLTITEDADNDGYINHDELDGDINYTIVLGDGTAVGDTITVTDQDGNEVYTATITQDMLDNGLSLSIPAPADGTAITLTATVTDPAGNTASGSDNALLSSGPAAPTVTITEDANDDGYINDAELSGQVNITVTLATGTDAGDTLEVTDQDGNTLFSGPVTQDMLDNGLELSIDPPATGTELDITATVTDSAGNSAEGTDSATLDYGVGTGAPAAPTVVIDEDAN
ncbi:beta strand repeat-containing protein, partial [Grimontia marina]|uniref:beta strand repeat-containing protein n=1 Tax=Grimontia marina TaxID=646534 RepID=UPI000A501028